MNILHIAPYRLAEKLGIELITRHNQAYVWFYPSTLTVGLIPYVKPFTIYDKMIIWHGNDAESLLLFYWCCTSHIPLFQIDVYANRHILEQRSIISADKRVVTAGNLPERGIRALFHTARKVNLLHKWWGALRWKYWSKRPTDLRILNKRGHLVAVSADYFDELLYSNISDKFRSATYSIALTLLAIEQSGNVIPDDFLLERLEELIASGKVEKRPCQSNKVHLSLAGVRSNLNFEIRKAF